MKKRFVIFLMVQCICSIGLFAGSKIKLKKNQVAVVAKVNVKTNSNMNFFHEAFECTEEDIARKSNYFLPCLFPKEKVYKASEVIEFEEQAEAEEGEYCLAIYELAKDRNLYFNYPIQYMYHKIYTMNIFLPMNFKVHVPEDVSCIYIGDLNYTVSGDNFDVTGLKIVDSYEDAKVFLNSIKGLENQSLCRGEPNSFTDDDAEALNRKYTIDMSAGKSRFKMKNLIYSYKK